MKPFIPPPAPKDGKILSLKDWIYLSLAVLLVLSPLVLFFLPADFFDGGPVICPSKRFLDLECPGCGLTRATQHFLHGEWEVALDYNPLVVVVVPILAVVWVVQLVALIRFFRAYWAARQKECRDSPPVLK
jgi:hypothetical protein